MEAVSGDITAKLRDWSRGDPDAFSELMPMVVGELKRAAHFYFQREDVGHTLEPTALVSEVCLRLMGRKKVSWENRKQFFAFAGKLMRYVLIDHAKARKAAKREGSIEMLSLTGAMDRAPRTALEPEILLSLQEALTGLEEVDPRAAQVVELRFFAGLTSAETATVLGISRATVTRDWEMAKQYLARELGSREPTVRA